MKNLLRAVVILLLVRFPPAIGADLTPSEATVRLREVIRFYRSHVGFEGAYLWRYSADLEHQEGEESATRTSGWTQPPGTPTVGETFLRCWKLTDDPLCLEAAVETASALVRGQLQSGGWAAYFDLGEGGRRYAYRSLVDDGGSYNRTTFDDNKTQSALMFLMRLDEALQQKNPQIHEAVVYALNRILAVQFPNGAWPQQYTEPPVHDLYPVVKANYPKEWPRTFPQEKYTGFYTLNDANMSHLVNVMLEAHRIYGRNDCLESAKRTGDFFLLSQMPEPQPGWAQQYNREMHPVWARKFEPAAVTGGESQSVMRSLLTIFEKTGERRYIATIPKALSYYRKSLLPDGRLARFYELHTNKPLYFTRDYKLTYQDDDLPTHYSFKVASKLDSIEARLQKLQSTVPKERPDAAETMRLTISRKLRLRAEAVVEKLDDRGAWVEPGTMKHRKELIQVIDMRTFTRSLEALAAFAGSLP